MTYATVISAYAFATSQSPAHTDVSNLLFQAARNTGTFRYSLTAGAYAFPVVGLPLLSTFASGANTSLFGLLPAAYAQYAPSATFTLSAGKLPTLLGQESGFTFQNVNIERGLAWNAEPVISRGIRAAYAKGALTIELEYNDGYYSGSRRALEGLAGYAPSGSTNLQFAFVLPDPNTPGNLTSAIANKTEYNLMLTQNMGKLQLTPYVLLIDSPASTIAGFRSAERASAQVMIADYDFNTALSLAARFEHMANASLRGDASANADLVGYGSGSAAQTWTFTPAYRAKQFTFRTEYSKVRTNTFASAQTRIGLEILGRF